MRTLALAALVLAAAAGSAGARPGADPEDYILLIARYVDACHRYSPEECTFSQPPSQADAERLACLFDELELRGDAGTAGEHVDWIERFADTGEPPSTGFPSTIGHQQILMASLIACRMPGTDEGAGTE